MTIVITTKIKWMISETSQNLKQEARSNNGDVLPQNKLR